MYQQQNLGDLRRRQPTEQHISCMLKVTSRELAGIWLTGPPRTILVSKQQCGHSPAVDGKTPHAYAVGSTCHCMLYISSFCEVDVSGGAQKMQKSYKSEEKLHR